MGEARSENHGMLKRGKSNGCLASRYLNNEIIIVEGGGAFGIREYRNL